MPWKECRIVEERLRFIARLLDGEKMAGLCREFGISRKTGSLDGLTDRSRRPYRHANQLPMQIEKLIVRLKREYPRWGAPKIREKLRRRYPALPCPAISTVHAVLDRQGLVTRRRRRRYKAEGTALSRPATPNELWCADYKGEFMLADRRYCYPLTITDFASRYLITCDALATTKETYTFTVFERAFKDFGLPRAIRTDNGIPFSCPNALYGLSRLSVWWLHQTRAPGAERSSERMHLTLKTEATKPASPNFLHQQARFDAFVERFNQDRLHQALGMQVPAEVYRPSPRPCQGLGELDYPSHDWTATVTRCGRICYHRMKRLCCNFRAATSGWTTFGKHRTGSPIMPSDNPFKWRQFEPALILQGVRWYLRYALSYRDLEDMMRERGLCVDHTTIYRWVQRYAPEIDKRCRPFLRRTNDSYRIDETYVRVAGAWTYLYRGVDSNGDTLDFLLRATRDRKAAIAFFRKTLGAAHTTPPRVVTVDKNPAYPVAFEAVRHEGLVRPRSNLRQCKYLNNIIEQDHRFIKRRTRPMLGFKRFTTAWRTLRGIEIMHALRKGQARWMAKGDVVGQTQLIHKVFGLAA